MNYELIFREVSINVQSFKSSASSLKIPKRAWWKIKCSFFSKLLFDIDCLILRFLRASYLTCRSLLLHQMQFIFIFRLFSYIRVRFLRQKLEWSGRHVVLIFQLKVFLKIDLVITVIKTRFYNLPGSVPTSSWLFFTLWQVKIYFIVMMTTGDSVQTLTQLLHSCSYLCCLLGVSWTDRTYEVATKLEL